MDIEKVFICNFFDKLNSSNDLQYVVLRNYEELPHRHGRDIDILVKEEKNGIIVQNLEEFIKESDWNNMLTKNDDFFFTLKASCFKNDESHIILIDIWTDQKYRGNSWINIDKAMNERYQLNDSGIYVCSPGLEAAICTFKEVFGKKHKVPEKYYDNIKRNALVDKNNFINSLNPTLGDLREIIWNYCVKNEFYKIDRLYKKIKRKICTHNIYSINLYLTTTAKRIIDKINNYLKPPGKFVVVLGPDGSGKTSIINEITPLLKAYYNEVVYFHVRLFILPQLKTGHGFSSMGGKIRMASDDENENEKITKAIQKRSFFSKITAWIVVLYYHFEFILGNFQTYFILVKNKLIIFDRYFYDYFFQPATCDLIWPYRKILLRMINKPNLIIRLKARPETILSRKKELSAQEIRSENAAFDRLLSEIPNVYVIETDDRTQHECAYEAFTTIKNLSSNKR